MHGRRGRPFLTSKYCTRICTQIRHRGAAASSCIEMAWRRGHAAMLRGGGGGGGLPSTHDAVHVPAVDEQARGRAAQQLLVKWRHLGEEDHRHAQCVRDQTFDRAAFARSSALPTRGTAGPILQHLPHTHHTRTHAPAAAAAAAPRVSLSVLPFGATHGEQRVGAGVGIVHRIGARLPGRRLPPWHGPQPAPAPRIGTSTERAACVRGSGARARSSTSISTSTSDILVNKVGVRGCAGLVRGCAWVRGSGACQTY